MGRRRTERHVHLALVPVLVLAADECNSRPVRVRVRPLTGKPAPLDNCDDAETGNAQESNGYDELPELQAVVIDRALHDELTAAIA